MSSPPLRSSTWLPFVDSLPAIKPLGGQPFRPREFRAPLRNERLFSDEDVRSLRALREAGMTFKQISDRMGCSISTAHSAYHGNCYEDVE